MRFVLDMVKKSNTSMKLKHPHRTKGVIYIGVGYVLDMVNLESV